MSEKIKLEDFTFESREVYDRAEKELGVIHQLENGVDLNDGKNALKVYNKAVSDKVFETVIGYCFLHDLRRHILQTGVTSKDRLDDIPVRQNDKGRTDTITQPPMETLRYKRMYEGQRINNKKFKIALVAMAVVLFAFVFINFRMEYSVFTYFTNYKANMEEELIDKYEDWQSELEEREKKLNEQSGGSQGAENKASGNDKTETGNEG